jgi:hypothetical protein
MPAGPGGGAAARRSTTMRAASATPLLLNFSLSVFFFLDKNLWGVSRLREKGTFYNDFLSCSSSELSKLGTGRTMRCDGEVIRKVLRLYD